VEGRPRPALDTGFAGGAAFEAGLGTGAALDAGLGAALEAGLEEAGCQLLLLMFVVLRDIPARAILVCCTW
jgi:hypothetical protein